MELYSHIGTKKILYIDAIKKRVSYLLNSIIFLSKSYLSFNFF